MQKLKLHQFSNKNLKTFFNTFILFLVLLLIVFSRSFIGIYIFEFRIGELIVGFSVLFSILTSLFFSNEIRKIINKKHLFYFLTLQAIFLINYLINDYQLNNLYIFRSSSFIWLISYLFLFSFLFQNGYLVI